MFAAPSTRTIRITGNGKETDIDVDMNASRNCKFYAEKLCLRLRIKSEGHFTLLFRVGDDDELNRSDDDDRRSAESEGKINELVAIGAALSVILRCADEMECAAPRWLLHKWRFSCYDKALKFARPADLLALYEGARLAVMRGSLLRLSRVDMAMAATLEMLHFAPNTDVDELAEDELFEFVPPWAQAQHSFAEWKETVLKVTWHLAENGSLQSGNRRRFHTEYLALVNEQRLYGVSLFAAHLLLPPTFNDGECYLLGVNWNCLVVADAAQRIRSEYDLAQIRGLCVHSEHELRFRVRVAEGLFVPFRAQLFEPDAESLKLHIALLQKYAKQPKFVW